MVPRLLGARGATRARVCPRPARSPAPAAAGNTRVSIANYAWSNPQVHIDLGEKVTWDWLGPDLAHSVTGDLAQRLQWDSDPGTDAPAHRAGDTFTLQFNQPGTYVFQCKLHSFVRGEVIVSDAPGDPNSDPGPQPPLNIDVEAADAGRGRRCAQTQLQAATKGVGIERPDQRARHARRRVLPLQLEGQARLQRLRDLEDLHRHQPPRAGRRAGSTSRAQPGPLRGGAAGDRQLPRTHRSR